MKHSTKLSVLAAALLSVGTFGSVYAQDENDDAQSSSESSATQATSDDSSKAADFAAAFTTTPGQAAIGGDNGSTNANAELSPGFTPYGYPSYPKN